MVNWLIYKGINPFTLGPGNTKNFGGDGDFDLGRVRISLSYNEGDRIKQSTEPVWETDFTHIPVASGHDPCGYWWRGPYIERCGINPNATMPAYGSPEYREWEWSPWFTMPYYTTPPDTTPPPTTDPCANPPAFAFGSGATSLAPNSSANLTMIGGVGPYIWELIDETGVGFSLDYYKTASPVNTWRTSPTACGSATIRVTDYCGAIVEIDIKSTVGNWTTITPWSEGCWCGDPSGCVDCCCSCNNPRTSSYWAGGIYCNTTTRTRYELQIWKGLVKCCSAIPPCEWSCTGFCTAWDSLAASYCGATKNLLGGAILQQWTC